MAARQSLLREIEVHPDFTKNTLNLNIIDGFRKFKILMLEWTTKLFFIVSETLKGHCRWNILNDLYVLKKTFAFRKLDIRGISAVRG